MLFRAIAFLFGGVFPFFDAGQAEIEGACGNQQTAEELGYPDIAPPEAVRAHALNEQPPQSIQHEIQREPSPLRHFLRVNQSAANTHKSHMDS